MSKVVLRSRFPQIAAELNPKVDAALASTAETIKEDAKSRVPVVTGTLRDAIHVERKGMGNYRVVAGDDEAFYGHMVEYGTQRTGARPFLTPAAEAQREPLAAEVTLALRAL